jgi:hypothetical protein
VNGTNPLREQNARIRRARSPSRGGTRRTLWRMATDGVRPCAATQCSSTVRHSSRILTTARARVDDRLRRDAYVLLLSDDAPPYTDLFPT